jgi:hypothetical protein
LIKWLNVDENRENRWSWLSFRRWRGARVWGGVASGAALASAARNGFFWEIVWPGNWVGGRPCTDPISFNFWGLKKIALGGTVVQKEAESFKSFFFPFYFFIFFPLFPLFLIRSQGHIQQTKPPHAGDSGAAAVGAV